MIANTVHRAVQAWSNRKFGGQSLVPPASLHNQLIPTQIFNARADRMSARTAVVFIPGFNTIPLLQDPGAVGVAAKTEGADFVRFYHPNMLLGQSQLNYYRMIDEATAVVDALPHDRIVLAGSSFGGGMMRFVAERIMHLDPHRVTGMFGWMSVPPEALMDLFRRQAGWKKLDVGGKLRVVPPAPVKPFNMSYDQYRSVLDYTRTTSLNVGGNFRGPVLLNYGLSDEVGVGKYTEMIARQIGSPHTEIVAVDAGNRLSPEKIQQGLQTLLQRLASAPGLS